MIIFVCCHPRFHQEVSNLVLEAFPGCEVVTVSGSSFKELDSEIDKRRPKAKEAGILMSSTMRADWEWTHKGLPCAPIMFDTGGVCRLSDCWTMPINFLRTELAAD